MANLRHTRFGGGLAVVLCTLLSLPSASLFTCSEEESFVTEEAFGTIMILNRTEGSPLAGMEWELYRIEGLPNDLNDEERQNAAYTLENEAIAKAFVPERSGISNENGEVLFDGVPNGVYLLSGKQLQTEDKLFTPAPMLVEVKGGELHIDLTPEAIPLIEPETTFTVHIDWQNDEECPEARGDSVLITIYKDGCLYDMAELNASNNWEMSWNGETAVEWSVEESGVPDEYSIIYQKDGTQFTIQNIYTPLPPESTEEETTTETPEETIESTDETTETTAEMTETTESTLESTITEIIAETTTTEITTTTTETTTTLPPASAPSTSTTRRKRTGSSAGVSGPKETDTEETDSSGRKVNSGIKETETTTAGETTKSDVAKEGTDIPPKTGQSCWLERICAMSGLIAAAVGADTYRRKNRE